MRASRLLAMMILLQLRQRVTAAELAAEFEVSVRSIYRDIDALSAAGVPVYAERGPGGGFALLDGYRTRLTGLDADEAAAMLLIGHSGPAAALGLGQAADGAQRKLIAALPESRRALAARMADHVHFDADPWYRGTEVLPQLPVLLRAVLDGHRIAMRYDSWTARRAWEADPLGLVMKAGQWYLVAAARAKIRIFRLTQMDELRLIDGATERPAGFDLASWWRAAQARFEAELFSTPAVIEATALGRRRLAALSPRGAAAVEGVADDIAVARVTMMVENSDHGAREILGLGAEVRVISPADLRARVHALARAIADGQLA